ncbi:hypothetical protein ASPCAL05710 [Aspergillus calidoustus]|uniref:Transcription factor domain-containing protein n=1 Tax=Aspergillus calidoustus TaxID=454130 RepID=A0A0U5FZ10_ASPCI|nr:hypothetical protein ASPCAL05710 [Aspergillus calidoustus]
MASSRDQHPDASSHIASHTHLSISIRTLRCPPARPLTETELLHMEYFHLICAKEFALFFDLPVWEDLILQQTHRETFLHHAALAIGALSRSRYHHLVTSTTWQLPNAIPFSIRQYGLAIQTLHSRLQGDQSFQGLELAALASVVFSQIEFLLGMDSQLKVHLRAGCAVLEELGRCDASSIGSTRPRIPGFCGGGPLRHRSSYPDTLLSNAILQLSAQVDSFKRARRARL